MRMMTPDHNKDPHSTEPATIWQPPSEPQSSRSISYRGMFSDRGTITAANQKFLVESAMEGDVASILLTHPDVVHVCEQPPAVTYVKPDGTAGRHTFDFVCEMRDGTKIAIAVKPEERTRKPGFAAGMARIVAQMPSDFAAKAVVVTEACYSRADASNARTVLAARLRPVAASDAMIETAIATLNGAIDIAGLMRIAGAPGEGFRAVVRAIDRGLLELRSTGRISSQTLVARKAGGSA